MASLYNIEEKYLSLIQQIEELDGELTPELEEELYNNWEDASDKIRAYYFIIKQTEGEILTIKDEIARLNAKSKQKTGLIERLKKGIGNALILFGQQQKKGNYRLELDDLTIFNVYHNPLVVEPDFNNDEFMKHLLKYSFTKEQIKQIEEALNLSLVADVETSVDKTKLKDTLKQGVEVPKAMLDKTAYYLRFI